MVETCIPAPDVHAPPVLRVRRRPRACRGCPSRGDGSPQFASSRPRVTADLRRRADGVVVPGPLRTLVESLTVRLVNESTAALTCQPPSEQRMVDSPPHRRDRRPPRPGASSTESAAGMRRELPERQTRPRLSSLRSHRAVRRAGPLRWEPPPSTRSVKFRARPLRAARRRPVQRLPIRVIRRPENIDAAPPGA